MQFRLKKDSARWFYNDVQAVPLQICPFRVSYSFPAKQDFLSNMCHDDVEFLGSYYEAIKERAEAMSKAYDIPIGSTLSTEDLPPAPPGR